MVLVIGILTKICTALFGLLSVL